MPFIKEKQLREKNKLINKYLKNREILRNRLFDQKLGKQQLEAVAIEKYKPIIEKLDEVQNKTEVLLQESQNKPLAIEPKRRPTYTVDFEKDFTKGDTKLLKKQDFDPGIINELAEKPEVIKQLIRLVKLQNKECGGKMRWVNREDKTKYRKLIAVNKKYYTTLQEIVDSTADVKTGEGLVDDPNKLCDRLNLLVSAKQAGNNNKRLNKEIKGVLKKLKNCKHISEFDHQKLCRVL